MSQARPSPIFPSRQAGSNLGRGRPHRDAPAPVIELWRQIPQVIDHHKVTLVTRPGASGFGHHDEADVLLGEALADDRAADILVFNSRAGLAGVGATFGSSRSSIVLTSSSLIDVEASRRTLAINGAAGVAVFHSHGTTQLPEPPSADAVALRIPKGRYPLLRLLRDAYQALRPGGRLYVGGPNDEGIKSALEKVERIFGSVSVRAYRGGARVGMATKVDSVKELPPDIADPLLEPGAFYRFPVRLRGHDVTISSRPGLFSWDALDEGSLLLIEAMRVAKGDRILDLGCGSGAVGLAASLLAGSGTAYLVDVDVDAIDSSRATMAENGQIYADVRPSDGITAVQDQRFDVVVTNPPFHISNDTFYDVAREFIRGAARVLTPAGQVFVVANRFIPYESTMAETFSSVETAAEDARFKVLVGRRRPRTR